MRSEQEEDIVCFVYDSMSFLWSDRPCRLTQLMARTISLVLDVEGFTQDEVFRILQKERYKK